MDTIDSSNNPGKSKNHTMVKSNETPNSSNDIKNLGHSLKTMMIYLMAVRLIRITFEKATYQGNKGILNCCNLKKLQMPLVIPHLMFSPLETSPDACSQYCEQ